MRPPQRLQECAGIQMSKMQLIDVDKNIMLRKIFNFIEYVITMFVFKFFFSDVFRVYGGSQKMFWGLWR